MKVRRAVLGSHSVSHRKYEKSSALSLIIYDLTYSKRTVLKIKTKVLLRLFQEGDFFPSEGSNKTQITL